MRRLFALIVMMGVLLTACSTRSEERVVLAAGTTVVDSGLIQVIVDEYRASGGAGTISVIGLSTQQVLSYAAAGNADVTITHDRTALDEFLDVNVDAVASTLFSSRFVLVGPPTMSFRDTSPTGVLSEVAERRVPFVSRDDGSGTHSKELALWASAAIDPRGKEWYVRTGTGMGATLQVANARSAVTLAEIGVFLTARDQLDLVPIGAPDEVLENPYDVAVIAPDDGSLASAFVAWLVSEDGHDAIEKANEAIFGSQVYRVP